MTEKGWSILVLFFINVINLTLLKFNKKINEKLLGNNVSDGHFFEQLIHCFVGNFSWDVHRKI